MVLFDTPWHKDKMTWSLSAGAGCSFCHHLEWPQNTSTSKTKRIAFRKFYLFMIYVFTWPFPYKLASFISVEDILPSILIIYFILENRPMGREGKEIVVAESSSQVHQNASLLDHQGTILFLCYSIRRLISYGIFALHIYTYFNMYIKYNFKIFLFNINI